VDSIRQAVRALGRIAGAAVFATLALSSWAICAVLGLLVVGLVALLLFPDPCLPFCVSADRSGRAEEIASTAVLAAAGVAALAVLYPMARRWRRASALGIPWIALLAITPLTVAALVLVDVLTQDAETLTCSC
jgi:hypothetical protein